MRAPGTGTSLVGALAAIEPPRPGEPLFVGYSGGMDSHVLLHALQARWGPRRVTAVHVDHGWHPASRQWAEHCRQVCEGFGVRFLCRRVAVPRAPGVSAEAGAREARFAGFAALLQEGGRLFLAHHRADQAETLLLRLARGSGVLGLGAMSPERPLAAGRLVRPLLDVSRNELRGYALEQGLQWLTDPANADTRHDRVYLREKIWPELTARWPGIEGTLARVAQLQRDNQRLLRDLALADMVGAQGDQEGRLHLTGLLSLTDERLANVLRHWLQWQGCALPPRRRMVEYLRQLRHSRGDRQPTMTWGSHALVLHAGVIHLRTLGGSDPASPPGAVVRWHPVTETCLRIGGGVLRSAVACGRGVNADLLAQEGCSVRFRCGGERLRLPGGRTRALKKLYQQWRVPPWERAALPLIYLNDRLLGVPGYGWAAEAVCPPGRRGIEITWRLSTEDCE